MQKKKVETFL